MANSTIRRNSNSMNRANSMEKRKTMANANSVIKEKPVEKEKNGLDKFDPEMQEQIVAFIKRKERNRKLFIILCALIAVASFSSLGAYSYFGERTARSNENWSGLVGDTRFINIPEAPIVVHRVADEDTPEILEKYRTLYNRNRRLVGWIKIEGTNIDFPVMQTVNNEYYLTHNFEQQVNRNGSIFLDYQCSIFPRSDNLIIYGHNMKSGQMFGQLDKYEKKTHFEKHPVIQFDTIYEEGTYEIMYAFRSRVYNEDEIVFKYYQFIDVISADEFYSNMREMAAMSYYDTGVTASFGDQILTLSTCDPNQDDLRFVVVARRAK